MPGRPTVIALRCGTVDLGSGHVRRADHGEQLSERERAVLVYLCGRGGGTVTREELRDAVFDATADDRLVDYAVRRLRWKIEVDPTRPDHLITVWQAGFRLVVEANLVRPAPTPLDRDPFVGRTTERDQVLDALARGRPVVVVGPPGIGKTRLAHHVARICETTGSVARIDLTDVRPELVVASIAVQLGVAVPERDDQTVVRLRAALTSDGPVLLVLDNCETAPAMVRKIVDRWSSPDLRILATSREVLGLRDEHVLSLGPLPLDDAASLFTDLATSAGGTALDGSTVGALVERLEGVPLAIVLAARRASALSPTQMLRRLDDRFRVLGLGPRDATDRTRSLRASLDVSWGLLSDPERQALLACSVFVEGFDPGSAAAVLGCPDPAPILDRLCDASLLVRGKGRRYRPYEFVREYAALLLAADPSAEAEARSRHFEHFGRRTAEGPPDDPFRLSVDRGNLVAAIREAVRRGRSAVAAEIAVGYLFLVAAEGPYDHGCRVCDEVLACPDLLPDARVRLLVRRAVLELGLGRDGLGTADQALTWATDAASRAIAHRARATALSRLGRRDESIREAAVALGFAREAGGAVLARSLALDATRLVYAGELRRARATFETLRSVAEPAGLAVTLAGAAVMEAEIDRLEGRFEAARARLDASVDVLGQTAHVRGLNVARRGLTWLFVDLGEIELARAEAEAAAEATRRRADPIDLGMIEKTASALARAEGDWAAVRRHAERTAALFDGRTVPDATIARGHLAEALLHLGELAAAETTLTACLEVATVAASPAAWAPFLLVRARLSAAQGRTAAADAELDTAERTFRELGYLHLLGLCHAHRARFCRLAGRDPGPSLGVAEAFALAFGVGPRSELTRCIAAARST